MTMIWTTLGALVLLLVLYDVYATILRATKRPGPIASDSTARCGGRRRSLPAGWSRTEGTDAFSRGTERAAKFKSAASFDNVARFYTERLPRDGWWLVAAREVKDRGRIRGERLLQFRRDGYELTIKSAGERAAALGWNYALEVMPEE